MLVICDSRRSRPRPLPALFSVLAFLVLPESAGAQVIPTALLDRITALELVNNQQSSGLLSATTDLTGLRAAVTSLEATSAGQGNLLDLNVAGLDALALDVADLRSTLGTIDVDILSMDARDDAQDLTLADHERRITTNTTTISGNTTVIADHERRITTNTSDIADHERRIAGNSADIADHGAALALQEGRIAETERIGAVHASGIADLRTDTDANTKRLDGHDRDIAALQRQMGTQGEDFRSALDAQSGRIETVTEGVAMAFALSSPAVAADKSFALSGGFGHFEGRNAFAVSGGIRASDTVQLDGGLAVGLESGSVGGRAGATISW